MTQLPRPEHPFPQMVRKNWQNLNGSWDFAFDFGTSGIEQGWGKRKDFSEKIIVPFCPESVLSSIGYTDFIPAAWYHRTIEIAEADLVGHILLHFGAVDYVCTVFVNGETAGTHRGGYTSFTFDITHLLHAGTNDITVCAEDDTRSPMQPSGKQSTQFASYGCHYTRTTGIWQTVWLESVPEAYIRNIQYYPNIAEPSVTVKAITTGSGTLTARVSYAGRIVGTASVKASAGNALLTIPLSERQLWEPGCGRLYDVLLTYGEDEVSSYFGLREVSLEGERFLINGVSVFQRLVLDQGFYPDGIYTAPTDEALEKDIRLSIAAGFNGARLHQKVFEPRYLYHADRLGYLCWGEFPSWDFDHSNYSSYEAMIPEWMCAIERDFNHPSIIGWCPFNETWDYMGHRQLDSLLARTYELTKQYDTTRPCIDTSGNYHVVTDIYDVHDYEQNVDAFAGHYADFAAGTGPFWDKFANRQHYTPGVPMFVSEYGGIKWSGPASDEKAWGYGQAPRTEEEFFARYRGLTEALLSNPHMFAFCYTQLTDVEQEQNGVYTYTREPKFEISKFYEINVQKAAIEE